MASLREAPGDGSFIHVFRLNAGTVRWKWAGLLPMPDHKKRGQRLRCPREVCDEMGGLEQLFDERFFLLELGHGGVDASLAELVDRHALDDLVLAVALGCDRE